MNYQAITDIIVNPSQLQTQLQELQLSNSVKDSPKQTSISFAEMLANENRNNTQEVTKEESASETKVEKGEKSDVAEKSTEKLTDSKSVNDKNEDRKISDNDSEKQDQKKPKIELKKEIPDSEKNKKSQQSEKTDSKNIKDGKKLTKKDFSRLDEIAKKDYSATQITENAEKIAVPEQNVDASKLKAELKSDKADKDTDELLIQTDTKADLSVNQPVEIESKTDNFEFDFSDKNQNAKKEFTLDKDGKIKVEDLRTENQIADNNEKKTAIKTSDIKLTSENTAVMSVELNPNAEADVLSLNTQTAAADGSNFQAMLSNQLHNVAPEFVKTGNLILKDNNQGTINLVLHPDDLGNVKIHLSLDGKTLSGHITVATKEALQVFKDNAETLREAFIKNGFDTAGFDVAMNNNGSSNQNMNWENQNDGTNLFAKQFYNNAGDSLDTELESIFQNAEDISNYSVNIVA